MEGVDEKSRREDGLNEEVGGQPYASFPRLWVLDLLTSSFFDSQMLDSNC